MASSVLQERQKAEEMFGGKKVEDRSKTKKAKTYVFFILCFVTD